MTADNGKRNIMKEVTLRIPDKKFAFFMELTKQLGFEVALENAIPEEQKAIVRDRMKGSAQNPDILLNWEETKDNFSI